MQNLLAQILNHSLPGCKNASNKPLPSVAHVQKMVDDWFAILFPGYFSYSQTDTLLTSQSLLKAIDENKHVLENEIFKSICLCSDNPKESQSSPSRDKAQQIVQQFEADLGATRELMVSDLEAAFEGDPAARSHEEVLLSYPGFWAIVVYRMANLLFKLEVPLLPRMMTEYAHQKTGIDIHPGAAIGRRFFIDHGTGVVIGETAVIGENVKVYQGVTLGALSIPSGDLEQVKQFGKRHPTLQNNVVVYAGATILGGQTIIGEHSIVGGNTWVTQSIPAHSKVMTLSTGQKII